MFQLDWGISLFPCLPLSQFTTCLLALISTILPYFIYNSSPSPTLCHAKQQLREFVPSSSRIFMDFLGPVLALYGFNSILSNSPPRKTWENEERRGHWREQRRVHRQAEKGESDVKAANFRRTAASSFFLHFCSCAEFLALFSPRAFFAFSIGFRAHLQPQRLFCSSLFSS